MPSFFQILLFPETLICYSLPNTYCRFGNFMYPPTSPSPPQKKIQCMLWGCQNTNSQHVLPFRLSTNFFKSNSSYTGLNTVETGWPIQTSPTLGRKVWAHHRILGAHCGFIKKQYVTVITKPQKKDILLRKSPQVSLKEAQSTPPLTTAKFHKLLRVLPHILGLFLSLSERL